MKKVAITIFWILFLGYMLYKLIPNAWFYFTLGFPENAGRTFFNKRVWFALHITSGAIVYVTGFFQFLPVIRNRNITLHRMLGRVYIIASLISILALFVIIPGNTCESCRPSQYMVTSLWLLFILAAFRYIRQRRIRSHQRMMIRGYICAGYFVTVRFIDTYFMGIFRYLFKVEDMQYLVSDISAWLVPLLLFETYWRTKDFLDQKKLLRSDVIVIGTNK